MLRNIILAPLVVFAIAFQAAQPAKPEVPTLTEVQRLTLENKVLRVQLTSRDFEAARQELQQLLKTLEKDGFTLDLQTLTYAPKPKAEKEK